MVYVALYIVKALWITGALYLLFVALCIGGYRAWRNHRAVEVHGGAEPVAVEATR